MSDRRNAIERTDLRRSASACSGRLWLYPYVCAKNLDAIANAVDIIGIHTYPYHMDVAIEDAFAETKESFESACAIYPDKQICFTELGWATRTAHDDHADYASVANQKRYLEEVADYLKSEEIVGFVFEAFDELWKDPSSPAASECNWGIYDINRKKKW